MLIKSFNLKRVTETTIELGLKDFGLKSFISYKQTFSLHGIPKIVKLKDSLQNIRTKIQLLATLRKNRQLSFSRPDPLLGRGGRSADYVHSAPQLSISGLVQLALAFTCTT